MPYLDEAARQLGISEKTLRAWMRKVDPAIEPQRHKYDLRYHIIAPEDVERIRQARAEKPGATAVIPMSSKLAFDRRQSGDEMARDVSPAVPRMPQPRQRQRGTSSALPDGLVSLTATAEAHGVFRYLSTFRRWRDIGKLECDPGTYGGEHGQFAINQPLTRKGLADFYRLASPYAEFQRCELCPHDADNDASGSVAE